MPSTHMPFEGGGPAVIALVGGETPAHVAANSELIARVEANRVRALADPHPPLPYVATITDTIPRHESVTWVSVFAPAGTPKPIVDRCHDRERAEGPGHGRTRRPFRGRSRPAHAGRS